MNIAQDMLYIRTSMGKNQGEMASILGITQQVYSNIENGRTKRVDQKIIEYIQQNIAKNNVLSENIPSSKPTNSSSNSNNSVVIDSTTTNQMLSDLIFSNKVMSTAIADFAITEKNLSEQTLMLTRITERKINTPVESGSNSSAHSEILEAVGSIHGKVLELLAELHSGKPKHFLTYGAALAELNKISRAIQTRNADIHNQPVMGIKDKTG